MRLLEPKPVVRLPSITLTKDDHDRLWRLAAASMRSKPRVASFLAAELERAEIVPTQDAAFTFVRIGSDVTFRDEKSDRVLDVTLVMPVDEDISYGRVSVMTPVGAALLGLSAGQSIVWSTPGGQDRTLTVIKVG